MRLRRFLISSLAVMAVLAFASCGSDDDTPTAVDTPTPIADDASDELVHPDTPVEDIGDDPDSNPAGDPTSTPVQDPAADPAGGIEPADGVEPPAEQVVTGRVVRVDRDGPSVEIIESAIATGSDATDAARAAGAIGPDEEWELDFYVVEGEPRWIDIDPAAAIAVYDCTQACEHVAGTLEHVLAGAPYGGADALWNFVLGDDGRATSVDEIYLP